MGQKSKDKNKQKTLTRVPFNKNWSIIEICRNRPPVFWRKKFEELDDTLEMISGLVEEEEESNIIIPKRFHIFAAFEDLHPCEVRVVFIGQDPYPQTNRDGSFVADGHSFSCHSPEGTIQMSLKNILREAQECYPDGDYSSGNLSNWKRQGCLMLNTSLTLNAGKPGSHEGYWLSFVVPIIKYVCEANPHCVFVLWGKHAKEFSGEISHSCLILESAHPVARMAHGSSGAFRGSRCFEKINEHLQGLGDTEIDWSTNV